MSAASTEPDWLPPPMAEFYAQQFLERMMQIDPSRASDPAKAKQGSRELVTKLRRQIDRWGPEGTVKRAPKLASIKLPSANQRELDAMARYQICSVLLMLQFEGGADRQQRQLGAMGLTATTLAILSLRSTFQKAGGREDRIREFLTSDEMERVNLGMQGDSKQIANSQTDCGKVVGELFAAL